MDTRSSIGLSLCSEFMSYDEWECLHPENVGAAANLWDHLANVVIQTLFKLVI